MLLEYLWRPSLFVGGGSRVPAVGIIRLLVKTRWRREELGLLVPALGGACLHIQPHAVHLDVLEQIIFVKSSFPELDAS